MSKATPQSILLVELVDIGDMALASFMWREIRGRFPNARITLVVQSSVLNLVELCPYVDRVLTFDYRDYPRWKRTRTAPLRWWLKALRFSVKELWPLQIDLAITPRWNIDGLQALGGIISYVSGAQDRVGFRPRPDELEKSRAVRANAALFTAGPEWPQLKHEVELRTDLLHAIGIEDADTTLEVWVSPADRAVAAALGAGKGSPIIALAPGAAWAFRRWPAAQFAALGRWLQEDIGATILLLASPAEEELCAAITAEMNPSRTINTAGKITLRQMAALLQDHCELFIGNDSGPLHVAGAASVPVVGLYGPGIYQRFGPWGEGSELIRLGLPCSPCPESCIFDRPLCMEGISLGLVQSSVRRILLSQPTSGASNTRDNHRTTQSK